MTFVAARTGIVVAENATDVDPAGIVTLAGTAIALELLVRFTTIPPVGAAAFIVTVPAVESPPRIVEGLAAIEVA